MRLLTKMLHPLQKNLGLEGLKMILVTVYGVARSHGSKRRIHYSRGVALPPL